MLQFWKQYIFNTISCFKNVHFKFIEISHTRIFIEAKYLYAKITDSELQVL